MFGGRFVNSKMMQSWGKWLPPHPIPPPKKKKIGFVYFLQCIKYNFMPQYDFIHCLQLRNAHTGSFNRVKLLVVFLAIVDFMAFARFPINEGNLTKMRLHEKMMSKQVQLLRKWLDHFYAPFLLIFIDQEPCRLAMLCNQLKLIIG